MIYNSEDIKISVILPVYNVEPWIGECIESLKRQKQDGLEFIFVDDCSTDNSLRIVEKWAAEDERVRILRNKENSGSGPSRNAGIEAARGEYLSFIDPDDWISADFYERLYSKAKETNCDIVKGVRVRIDDGCKEKDISPELLFSHLNSMIVNRKKDNTSLYCSFRYEHQTAIFKSTLFSDSAIRFGKTRTSQDVTFLLRICYETEDIEVIDDAVYYYRQRAGAATSAYTYKRAVSELQSLDESIDFLLEKKPNPESILYLCTRTARYLSDYYYVEKAGGISDEMREAYSHMFNEILEKSGHRDELLEQLPELEVLIMFRYAIPVFGKINDQTFSDNVERWIDFLSTYRDDARINYFKKTSYLISRLIVSNYKSGKLNWKSLKEDDSVHIKKITKIPAKGKAIGAAYIIYYLMGTIKRRIVRVIFKGTKTIS